MQLLILKKLCHHASILICGLIMKYLHTNVKDDKILTFVCKYFIISKDDKIIQKLAF